MEELLKFLTSKQSVRNVAFMFLWRILMCILITNEVMNNYGYTFTAKEITANLVISFIFTPEFLLVTFVYLICVFVFFWFFKILGFVLILYFSKKQMDSHKLMDFMEKSKLITQSNDSEYGYLITDSDSDILIKAIIDDKKNISESIALNIISNWFNVIFSSTLAYLQIYHKIPHLFGIGFGIFLLVLTFISIVISLVIVYHYATSDLLEQLRNNLSKFGYFKT